MPRARRATVTVVAAVTVLASAGAVVWKRVLPASREREAARAMSAFAVCLVGAPRVTPEEAEVRARRMERAYSKPGTIRRGFCVEEAEAITQSGGIRAVAPDLVLEVSYAAVELREERLPNNVAALWRAAEHLRWMPATGGAKAGGVLPEPLLDENIPSLRRALPDFTTLHDEIDGQPVDHAELRIGGRWLTVRADGGRPLARLAWEGADLPRGGSYRRDTSKLETPIARLGDREIRVHENKLWERRAGTGDAGWREVDDLTSEARDVRFESCRTRAGSVLAVDGTYAVKVLFVRDEGIDIWGTLARPHPDAPSRAGPVHVACDDERARISWSTSRGMGRPKSGMGGDEAPPNDRGWHQIITATCAPAPAYCLRDEVNVDDIHTVWRTTGGWSSPLYHENPDVIDLGGRLLLIWSDGSAIRYRLAPLAKLQGAPSPWIAEIARPEGSQPPAPRAVGWPRWQVLARGDTALVEVQEWGNRSAAFLLRFDASGDARVLVPEGG